MATITLTLSGAHLTRVVDAFCTRYDYSPFLDDGITPNPQSRAEFARSCLIRWIKGEILEHELNTARATVTVSQVDVT